MSEVIKATQVLLATRLMGEVCERSGIPYDVFEEAVVVQYRALRRADPNKFAEIERRCDEADRMLDLRKSSD